MARKFHIDGSCPEPHQVFVFGSNLSGFHGGGAARAAHQLYGAKWGVAEGLAGSSYAIPTAQERIAGPLSVEVIATHIAAFIVFASNHPGAEFFVTRIGCGLAGHCDQDIAPLFSGAPYNCSLPDTWAQHIKGEFL
jgi:hypothetical protein